MTALCEYGDGGCPDTAGNFDVVMPEPMDGTTSTGYKVRVMDTNDESNADCSSEFVLAASTAVDDGDSTRHITVTSPEDGDMAYAGQEYTVEVSMRFNVWCKQLPPVCSVCVRTHHLYRFRQEESFVFPLQHAGGTALVLCKWV